MSDQPVRHSFEVEIQWGSAHEALPPAESYRSACSCGWVAASFSPSLSEAEAMWSTRHLPTAPEPDQGASR